MSKGKGIDVDAVVDAVVGSRRERLTESYNRASAITPELDKMVNRADLNFKYYVEEQRDGSLLYITNLKVDRVKNVNHTKHQTTWDVYDGNLTIKVDGSNISAQGDETVSHTWGRETQSKGCYLFRKKAEVRDVAQFVLDRAIKARPIPAKLG